MRFQKLHRKNHKVQIGREDWSLQVASNCSGRCSNKTVIEALEVCTVAPPWDEMSSRRGNKNACNMFTFRTEFTLIALHSPQTTRDQ